MAQREDALEEALRQLREGVPLEEVAARYPELAPVLRAARILEAARPPAPSLRAELASRTAFLQRAEALRASRRPWTALFVGLFRYAPAGAAIAGLLVLVGVLHALAQRSLPGDPLYGLKRMEERVWLALTLDPLERRQVEETLAARRWEEYRALAERRGAGTVTWEGRIEAIEGMTWRIGGIPVEVFPETEILGPVALEERAAVTAFLGPGGQLVALRIQGFPEVPTPIPEPTVITPEPTAAEPTPSATPPMRIVPRTPPPTLVPSPTPAPAPIRTPTPSAVTTPSPVPEEIRTPTPAPTPTRGEEGEEENWEGILQAISGSIWIIDGRAVQVTANTEIRGNPRVGDRVKVRAQRQPDGTLIAERIERED